MIKLHIIPIAVGSVLLFSLSSTQVSSACRALQGRRRQFTRRAFLIQISSIIMADDVDHLGAQSPRDNTSAHFTHSRNTTLIGSPTLTRIHSREELTTNIMPGAFAYAPDLDLDTASEDAVLSFYLDNSEPHPSEYRMPAKPLLDYIKHSGLVREFRHRITDVLKMIVRIGDLLFPPTYQLNDEVKARILHYAKWMGQYMRAVVGHIQRRIDKADEGLGKLPPPKVVDKDQLALSIATWTQVIEYVATTPPLSVPSTRHD